MEFGPGFSSEEDAEPALTLKHSRKTFRLRINFDAVGFEFKEKFRLRPSEAEYVLLKIGAKIDHPNHRNKALSPKEQVLCALHWLGTGTFYHLIGDAHGPKKATVCRLVHRVVNTIIEVLFDDILKWPEPCDSLASDFFEIGQFPRVCGCIDGTLIPIQAPITNEEAYVNRHGNHSLNAMMICGPNLMFYCVNTRWPGAVHDARVLRNSIIAQDFDRGWRPFPGAVLLGDSGYGMKPWLLTPLRQDPRNQGERRFNRALVKTRVTVERAFGVLKARFPCLKYMRLQPKKAGRVIMSCVTLHNIATKKDFDDDFVEPDDPDEDNNTPDMAIDANTEAVLKEFISHFS